MPNPTTLVHPQFGEWQDEIHALHDDLVATNSRQPGDKTLIEAIGLFRIFARAEAEGTRVYAANNYEMVVLGQINMQWPLHRYFVMRRAKYQTQEAAE